MLKRLSAACFAFIVFASSAFGEDKPRANPDNQVQYQRGRVVRVDPARNVIIVRVGENDQAREQEYTVGETTTYWSPERQQINDGLRYKGFREGTDVWYRMGTGNNARSISEMRFYDPSARPNNK
jgi:hypothetical protein